MQRFEKVSSQRFEKVSSQRFEKVSFEQFKNDWLNVFCEPNDFELRENEFVEETYNNIVLPTRSTKGSAGYDFVSPLSFTLEPNEEINIPTGIRSYIDSRYFLMCVPRSGLGFKFYTRLANTVGIIDEDYVYSSNEGHIHLKLRNEGNKSLTINVGDKIMQGIFVPYGITDDDDVNATRDGGFGSTGR